MPILIAGSASRFGGKPMGHRSRGLAALSLAVAAVLTSAGAATAATSIFDGDAAIGLVGDNTLWAAAANWTTGGTMDVAPSDVAPGDDLTFGGGTAGAIIDLGINRFANSLTFTRNYTLGLLPNSALVLTNTTGTVSVAIGTTGTINSVLAGTTGLSLTGGGTLLLNRATGNTFTGNITVDGANTTLRYVGTGNSADPTALGTGAKTVTLSNGGTLSIITATSNPTAGSKAVVVGAGGGTIDVASGIQLTLDDAGQFSGTGSLTKTGPGLMVLTSQGFTYTGAAVNINAGTIRVGNAGSLGATNVPITVASGAVFDVQATLSGTKPITVGGTGLAGAGALIASGGTGVANGAVTLTSDTSLGGNGTLTLSGIVGDGVDTFNVTKVGTGVLALTGANTFGGNVTVNAGVLRGTSGTGLPTTANLNLVDGVFETTNASFTRALGTGAGQVQITGGSSGFSSQVAAANVNLGGAAAIVQFGSATFNPTAFVLNASSANNPITFANALDLNGATRTIAVNAAVANTATIAGVISDSTNTIGALTKTGTGVLILGATNTYTGATTVSAGSLRGALGSNIPTGSNLVLNGGAYETGVDLTATVGTAGGQVQLTGGTSGFSAFGAPVAVNLGGAGAAVQFGTATFSPTSLLLNQNSANNTIDFQNAIDLNGATRSITVNANVATVSGAITNSTGTAGLTKTGPSVLVLGNAGNSYTGATTVSAGALRATDGTSLPATSNLTLNGGVFEPSANFTRLLGGAAGQVQLTGGASGFSAFGAPVAVNLGGAGATVQWGSASFSPTSLVLNAGSANNTIDFQNGIDLNGATRTVAPGNAAQAGTISGVISNGTGTGNLTVNGAGVLVLTGTNTYNGTTTLTAGTLSVGSTDNLGAPTAPISFDGGTLRVTGTTMTGFGSRPVTFVAARTISFNIADAANNFTLGTTPALIAGQILLKSGAGTLTLSAPSNTVTQLQVNGGIVDIGATALSVSNTGSNSIIGGGNATINSSGAGAITIGTAGGTNYGDNAALTGTTLTINAKLTGANGFEYFGGTTHNGTIVLTNAANDYAGEIFINSAGTISVATIGAALANGPLGRGTNINLNSATGARLLYTGAGETTNRVLVLGNNGTVDASGTGLLRFTANVSATGANVKTLTLQGTGSGEIAGIIPNNSATNTTAIAKTGSGTWRLSGANTFTGNVTVSAGSLIATNSASLGTGTKTVTIIPTTNPTSLPSLRLDGSAGSIALPTGMNFTTSYDAISGGPIAGAGAVVNVAGNNSIAGNFSLTSGGGGTTFLSDADTLTLSGNISAVAGANAARTVYLRGNGNGLLSGVISDGSFPVSLTREVGGGIWSLTGANTYTGATTITAGQLLANNLSGSATGTGAVTVSGTGTFGGSGSVTSSVNVNSGGTLAPGNGVGVLSTGALTFATGSHLGLQLASTTPATGYDQVNVTGAVNLTGGDIQLSLGAFTPLNDDLFYILLNDASDAITGTFAGLSDGSIFSAGGQAFKISYAANWTGDQATSTFTGGNDIALQAVPEPASAMFLLAGLGLLARRRRG